MVRAATPDHAAPALDIRLNQNPNAFFFPASTISGHVVYQNHYGNADYDLRLIFVGVNKVILGDGTLNKVEKATLFEYTFNLHTARRGRNHKLANSQVDTAPMTFPFKHRFPSVTDNRSFSLMSHSAMDAGFNSHVHDLPPSFGAHSYNFECSVEYTLRAELHYDKCLLTQHTLPIMFLPYMRPVHGTRIVQSHLMSSASIHKAPHNTRKDSFITHLPDTTLAVAAELPSEVTVGIPFAFEVHVQLPFLPTYDDEIPVVQVRALRMSSFIQCRAVKSTGHTSAAARTKSKAITLHPSDTIRSPTLDPATNTVYYTFQATLSSYYPPSFRSFLVANTFSFEGPVLLSVDGVTVEIDVLPNNVTVLSPVIQQTGMKRASTITPGIKIGI